MKQRYMIEYSGTATKNIALPGGGAICLHPGKNDMNEAEMAMLEGQPAYKELVAAGKVKAESGSKKPEPKPAEEVAAPAQDEQPDEPASTPDKSDEDN